MAKIYVETVGVVILIDMGTDISLASTHEMIVLKDGEETTWDSEVYQDNYLKYTTQDGDLDVAGTYIIHPNLEFTNGWSGVTKPVSFKVHPKWKQ